MRKSVHMLSLVGVVVSFTLLPVAAYAEEEPKAEAPASPHTFTSNVGLYSDYIFRGLTYAQHQPAVQGGIDYAHSSGLYLGTWATSIDDAVFIALGAPQANAEVDFYGGYIGSFKDLSFDVGLLHFTYFDAAQVNTLEAYAGATFKGFNVKYSHSITEFFNIPNSENSYYIEANYNLALPLEFGLGLHVGYQNFEDNSPLDYTDWRVSVSKALGNGFAVGVNYTDTDADTALFTFDGEDIGESVWTVYFKRTF